MWLYVMRSNNQPNNVAAYFLDAVVVAIDYLIIQRT